MNVLMAANEMFHLLADCEFRIVFTGPLTYEAVLNCELICVDFF